MDKDRQNCDKVMIEVKMLEEGIPESDTKFFRHGLQWHVYGTMLRKTASKPYFPEEAFPHWSRCSLFPVKAI